MNHKPSFGRPLAVAVAFCLTAALATAPAVAGPFDSVTIFGDSLSDSGNNAAAGLFNPLQVVTGNTYVPSDAYAPAMTYSNGPVWATRFASSIGLTLAPSLLGGSNYAFGGATTGTPGPGAGGFPYSLLAQANQFLTATGGVASPNGLYVIAGGGNNARAALEAVGGGANFLTTAAATASAFASDVGSIVDSLQSAGAAHILVWNTPNLGLTPAVQATGFGAAGSFLASIMNDALSARLAGEAGVSTFDIFGFGTQAAAMPATFGFTNVTDACGAVAGADCASYLYWDGIHPTAAAHAAIAAAVFAVAIPEPETYALMLLGLASLGWHARRRAARRPAAATAAR